MESEIFELMYDVYYWDDTSTLARGLKLLQNGSESISLVEGFPFEEDEITKLIGAINQTRICQAIRLQHIDARSSTSLLGRMIEKCSSLIFLNISTANLNNNGLLCISDALAQNQNLRYLNLSSNFISDFGVESLGEALKVNRSLVVLNLAGNSVELRAPGNPFFDALWDNKSLTHLDLRNNKVGLSGTLNLANALQKNIGLTFLDISENDTTSEGTITLKNSASEKLFLVCPAIEKSAASNALVNRLKNVKEMVIPKQPNLEESRKFALAQADLFSKELKRMSQKRR
eukprot:CAMPEP_0204863822 /NCGR_PEP_ID=MMETSP1348-20121228/3598_1 /ASSEMBLY_ACC=CAM_ASM_000700 /TAXON_ID=215587 /ORGANISM="Aplanochytrium stocchinoi, Strain GSBS06" /LENGTH=287 /DNA_ID=CAMNT_0052014257 /DNA_START=310 /DNA_END=1173 /DNA_ORIENTATION=+